MTSYKEHFSRFLSRDGVHAAAHSHHPWPDVTFEAQQQAWLDAARLHDDKWDYVFDRVIPEAQSHIGGRLSLPDPTSIAFAPNTHELVGRVMSCLPTPARVLTTDAEFHSFARQLARWEEAGRVTVERIASAPLTSFTERFAEAAARGGHDLIFFSSVLFDSGYAVPGVEPIVDAVPDNETFVVVDGYHQFMALPTDLSALATRVFYVAGGYKYAMAGEGACFLHCPPGYGERPVNTGWYAGFGALTSGVSGGVGYPTDGGRFLGATFDVSALYRFNAVQRWLDEIGVSVDDIHAHVAGLQDQLLSLVADVLPAPDADPRGHFLSFLLPNAGEVYARLHAGGVVTDYRGERLRIGLGLYHDAEDVEIIAAALSTALSN